MASRASLKETVRVRDDITHAQTLLKSLEEMIANDTAQVLTYMQRLEENLEKTRKATGEKIDALKNLLSHQATMIRFF
jgi:predicted RNA-binding protein (virulence factor B family)